MSWASTSVKSPLNIVARAMQKRFIRAVYHAENLDVRVETGLASLTAMSSEQNKVTIFSAVLSHALK